MKLDPIDLAIVGAYLAVVVGIGVWIKKRATRGLDAYYPAGRGVPWWMPGLAGCSSYIDIGGTMAMVGLLFYVGLKGLWATHLFWGWPLSSTSRGTGIYLPGNKGTLYNGWITFPRINSVHFKKDRSLESFRKVERET